MKSFFRNHALAACLALAALASPAKAADINVDGNLKMLCGTAVGSTNASTLNNKCGVVTTESLTTAAGATFLETITDTAVAATDLCFASVTTAGTGSPAITKVAPGASSLAITTQNIHSSAAFNAVLTISYMCIRP